MKRAERFSIVMVLVVASIAILAGNATVGIADSSSTNGLLRFSGGSVEMIHDFLEDNSHFYEVENASDPPLDDWSSAGAPTILYDNGTYYLVLRRWAPTRLGYRFEMWTHVADNLLTPWTFVWGENKENIDETLVAMDRPILRKFGENYYLYFTYSFGECAEWSIAYVSDGTISGIRDKLINQTQWNVIFTGGMKDPWVTKFENTYYMCLYSILYPQGYFIVKSNTPGFEVLGGLPIDLHKPYTDVYGGDDFNVGPVLYDPSSGKYLYWGTARHGTDIYWFWCSSDDLETWNYAGREMVFNWGSDIYTTARYQDYSLDNGKAVLVMEWDHDKDMASSTFLWEYPIIPPWTGTATFKLENLYKVSLGKDLQLNTGSKLVVKFYKYDNTPDNQSVIDNFVPPVTILENENVPRPVGTPVEIVRLVLTTDDTENVISTIASWTATKSVLASRYLKVKTEYVKPGADKPALASEYLKIKSQYVKAP